MRKGLKNRINNWSYLLNESKLSERANIKWLYEQILHYLP